MSKSILLPLDGSQESLFAADIAASLAEKKQVTLTGMTVIDSQSLWEIAGQDLPGIIGSGPYVAAYQSIESALRSVAETLMVAFESRVVGRSVGTRSVIEQGDIVEYILKGAETHGLVVMGHKSRMRRRTIHKRQYFHSSICQLVADSCPVPLLIVQDAAKLWTKSTLLLSADTYDKNTVKAFIDLALCKGSEAEIICTGRSKTIDEMLKVVHSEIEEQFPGNAIAVVGKRLYELEKFFSMARASEGETLFVLTTCNTEQGRKVCTGESLDYVIRDVARAYTLFLPPASLNQQIKGEGGQNRKVKATASSLG